jgi:hypothetical protein
VNPHSLSDGQYALQQELADATLRGDVERMEHALAQGADPDWTPSAQDAGIRQAVGNTCLHTASSLDIPEAMQVLVKWGADVNARDAHGNTPLMHTCERSAHFNMHILLNAGASMDMHNKNGDSARSIVANKRNNGSHEAESCAEVFAHYDRLPRIDLGKSPETLKERLLRKTTQGYCPLDNPQVWQQFDTIGQMLIEQGTPLTKEDIGCEDFNGDSLYTLALRCRGFDKLLGHLRDQGDRLSNQEIYDEPMLLADIMDAGAVPHLFTEAQQAPEGYAAMRELKEMVGTEGMRMVRNQHSLRTHLLAQSQAHISATR